MSTLNFLLIPIVRVDRQLCSFVKLVFQVNWIKVLLRSRHIIHRSQEDIRREFFSVFDFFSLNQVSGFLGDVHRASEGVSKKCAAYTTFLRISLPSTCLSFPLFILSPAKISVAILISRLSYLYFLLLPLLLFPSLSLPLSLSLSVSLSVSLSLFYSLFLTFSLCLSFSDSLSLSLSL